MAIKGVDTKCYILALFVRDDGERFLLGSGHYEFKNTQMHFAANAIQNDIVEVQGNDGFLLAGQVRRPGTQSFDGYVGDGTMSKEETESYRRQFFSFFRKNFFYKVIYVFSDGTAIQRKSGFLVDDPTVEELYQMYPEYHVALNFEDVNYYSYSEDEEGQEQYAKEATIDTSSMRATGGLVWDNLGVVWEATQWGGEQTASGTEMTIRNEMSVPSRVDDIRLDGDTYQQTYSGKNLFNKSIEPIVIGGGTNTVTETATGVRITVTTAGTYSFRGWIVGKVSDYLNNTLTLSANVSKSADGVSPNMYIGYCNDVGGNRKSVASVAGEGEKSCSTQITEVDADGREYIIVVLYGTEGRGASIGDYSQYDDVQLQIGEETAYEPYVGGIPAPNPDYPQDVQTVTGEQTVEVTGKNKFNTQNLTTNWRTTIVSSDNNNLVLKPNVNGSGYLTYVIDAKPSTTYTISLDRSVTGSSDGFVGNIAIYRFNGTNQNAVGNVPASTNTFTFTTASDTIELRFLFYSLQTTDGTWSDVVASYTNIQVEESDEKTAYQPYQSQSYTISLGSIELCKIRDYQDYIYKSDDDWYVHKATARVDVSSLGGWFASGSYAYKTRNGMSDILPASSDSATAVGLCNAFSASTTNLVYAGSVDYGFALPAAGGTGILIRNKNVASLADFTTYLSNNPVYGYFVLATPTNTKITDDTLIGQLNALGAMRLFIGENNLLVQATGTNLPAPLTFKYYTTVAMTGAEWEEGGSGGATVVEVDSITNTYPIWRVKGPAVDPQLSVINTNTTIRYTGTVTSTQTLEIDMFNKTAKLNGVSVIGNVSGDWVSLAPGTNRVIYTAENADAQPSTIEWQEVVG